MGSDLIVSVNLALITTLGRKETPMETREQGQASPDSRA
jgi:hypothetical protein